jgi:hypothetical protein
VFENKNEVESSSDEEIADEGEVEGQLDG